MVYVLESKREIETLDPLIDIKIF